MYSIESTNEGWMVVKHEGSKQTIIEGELTFRSAEILVDNLRAAESRRLINLLSGLGEVPRD